MVLIFCNIVDAYIWMVLKLYAIIYINEVLKRWCLHMDGVFM